MATMLCHKSTQSPDSNFACAGWIAAQGTESIGVRLLMLQGKVDPNADYSGGHDLYTFDQMLKANKIRIPKKNPYDHNIEQLKRLQRNS